MKKIIDAIKKLLGMSDKPSSDSSSSSQGFTLIELLVVIAVIGVLAAAVLIAIDPVQQLARGRDSGRKQSLAQVGRAVEAYYTVNSTYPSGAGTWVATLQQSGEIKLEPQGYAWAGTACAAAGFDNNLCIVSDTDSFVVYGTMESNSENTKGACAVGTTRYYAYASLLGRAGTVCGNPGVNFAGTMY